MGTITLTILIVAIIIMLIWTILTYNSFITLGERVNNGQAQIATQIESRWDALQSLIHATKKYAKHEAKTLDTITGKRANIRSNSSMKDIEKDDIQFSQVIHKLLAISENYPDLKASDVYQTTMTSIRKFEDNVRGARMIYNDVVTKFNRKSKSFPSNIIAKVFKFKAKEYFQGTELKQEMPGWD